MSKLTDEELIEELKLRFEEKKQSVQILSELTKQLQLLYKKLKESEGLKSRFLSNIQNEMNNPLASILGLSKIISSVESHNLEKARSMAESIHAEAFNLDFQLKNIFAAAELESGEAQIETVKVDLEQFMQGLVEMYRHKLQQKKLTLRYSKEIADKTNEKFYFRTDPAKLQIVLSNILSNAINFSHPAKEVKVCITHQQGTLRITVQDYGIGIDPSEQDVIFNRFTQLDSGVTKKYRGHGLGLSVSKDFLELINGTIQLTSSKEKGSIFTVILQELPGKRSSEKSIATNGNELLFNSEELF